MKAGASQTSITVAWGTSNDDVGVAGYGAWKNGVRLSATLTRTSATFINLLCGRTYVLGIDAVDAAGNRSAPVSIEAATAAC